jgi:small-conductance mechanosensitive channel
MNLTVFLSVLGIIVTISYVLAHAYKQDKNSDDSMPNKANQSLKSLVLIQLIGAPIITYVAVTQIETLYLFLYYAVTLIITGLGFFHRSKFFGYYASLLFSFIFLVFYISFGKNYFQQLNNAINIMYIVCILYAFALNMLLLTIYKPHFANNTVASFKNPFKSYFPTKKANDNTSNKWVDSINKIKVSSSFAITLIIFFFLYMFLIRPIYAFS